MKFSIIIPIYNAERYISQTLNSVINQSVDFNECVEIIIIDDGSTDRSRDVCQRFAARYPDNIKYFTIENSGPSTARNVGISKVSPKTDYIGFLDADDYFSSNTLKETGFFFSENPQIKMAVIPLYHFEAMDTPHRLNYRFNKGNRIVDIIQEHRAIQFHIGGTFFKADTFTGNPEMRFPTDISFWEDALLINTFLLKEQKYGVVAEPKYYYRKRISEDSLVNQAWFNKARYTELIRKCYFPLINDSKDLFNEVIPYVQFLIIYHFKLFLSPKNNHLIYEVLGKQEQGEFFNSAVEMLQHIDDRYISNQNMPFYYKKYLLDLKRGGWPFIKSKPDLNNQKVTLTEWKHSVDKWLLTGHFKNKEYMMKPDDQLFIKCGEETIYLPKRRMAANRRIIWGTLVQDYSNSGFTATIPAFCFKFQFGIETKEGQMLLNRVNMLSMIPKLTIKKYRSKVSILNKKIVQLF